MPATWRSRPAPSPTKLRTSNDRHVWSSICSGLAAPFASSPPPPEPDAGVRSRAPASGERWRERFLDADQAGRMTCDEAVRCCHSVLVVDGVATPRECAALRAVASDAASAPRNEVELARGKVRLPVRTFDGETRRACEVILARGVERTRSSAPALLESLFGDLFGGGGGVDARTFFESDEVLGFTPNEPALNVYRAGGSFPPHEDGQYLTVLVPLSSPRDFHGGGTAFWARRPGDADAAAGAPPPALVEAPTEGTALVFCGSVLHAALPVEGGERSVLVASFSRRGGVRGDGRDPDP